METGKAHLVCATADLAPGTVKRVEIGGDGYAVYNIDGSFYVTDDRCTHGLASLAEGALEGDVIECAMHFGGFHVPTGKPVLPPCSIPLRTYVVEVRDEQVFAVI
jgi:nitrite reductase/ring-hydroxylating ferredoxin subunit